MKRRNHTNLHSTAQRMMALALSAVLVLCLLPSGPNGARAADWMEPYLEKLVSWGVMRGDINGNLHPERNITRAEFVTMVNRAYGYDQMGENPFTDVDDREWYADDIRIAYNMGYFVGTSPNTASPNSNLTREQAAVLLGRNMMFRNGVGEVLNFSDGREVSDWARGMVREVANAGVVGGYEDGSFQPQKMITRGEVAVMLVRSLGTLIQDPGDHSMGSVYGNVTITTSGVTLRDTVIAGDLYLTGGIALGDVNLENVTVLGRIIASGGGESSKGESSIILRNVTANEMIVDSLADQFVTIRSEGDTNIGTTSVRTSSYLEDVTNDDLGLRLIEFDADPESTLQLAGNIKELVNLTPESSVVLAQGKAGKITIDEKAVESKLTIDGGAFVKELNLDVGTEVGGKGDISHLNVNAPGSKVEMLPDTIVIRPGINADIKGENMDSAIAAEHSDDPRILAGYPAVRNIAPKTADAVFSTNKKGTIRWAITALADGSATEEELFQPPAYSGKILKNGTLGVNLSKTEVSVKLNGLTAGGSYYLAAVLEDARGQRSAVKVISFTTPDDTVPNFAPSYPFMSKITNEDAWVTVMPTKSCQLYYALMPKGATAPKPTEFKANAVIGNLGFGSIDVVKNTSSTFIVNNQALEELKGYDLYLWLTDYDGVKSSAVKKLSFNTVDKTPPTILHMDVTNVKATSVELTYAIDEPATLFWAVVKEGELYPKPMNGEAGRPDPAGEAAKIQVESGMNALKNGRSNAGKANTDVKFTVSGLKAETAYDLYYIAKDKAGNYSVAVKFMTINTLDDKAPRVTQEFTRYNGDQTNIPLADTDIRLVFSEGIKGWVMEAGERKFSEPWVDLYMKVQKASATEKEAAKEALAAELRQHITLNHLSAGGLSEPVVERKSNNHTGPWVIDYRNVTITMEDGQMVMTFPHDSKNPENSAINLASGASYQFHIESVADTSTASNLMGATNLPKFTTVFAQVRLSQGATSGTLEDGSTMEFDMSVKLTPVATESVEDGIMWDMLLWSASDIEFEMYWREGNGNWKLAQNRARILPTEQDRKPGTSMTASLLSTDVKNPEFEQLNGLKTGVEREYAIVVKKLNGNGEPGSWSETVTIDVDIVAGDRVLLDNLSSVVNQKNLAEQKKKGVVEIGLPQDYDMQRVFRDSKPPIFTGGYPRFRPGDSGTIMEVQIDRNHAYYYYAVAPVTTIATTLKDDSELTALNWASLSDSGHNLTTNPDGDFVKLPTSSDIMNPQYKNIAIKTGNGAYSGGTEEISVSGLTPLTKYVAYFVLKGDAQDSYSDVYCFRFETTDVTRPVLTVQLDNPVARVLSNPDRADEKTKTDIDYMMIVVGKENELLKQKMGENGNWNGTQSGTAWDNYKGKTLLEAMQLEVKSEEDNKTVIGSVFDVYADQGTKDAVASMIRTQSSTGQNIAAVGSAQLQDGVWWERDCEKDMAGTAKYWFVVVGKSPLGSGDAFRANKSLFVPDTAQPKVQNIAVTLDENTILENDYTKAANKPYSGTLVVTFSEELFYKSSDNLWTPVVDKKPPIEPGYTSSLKLMTQLMPGITLINALPYTATEADYVPCYSLMFDLNNVKPGTPITFDRNLCDENGITGAVPLTLTMELELKNGLYHPVFKPSPAEWLPKGK